MKNIVTNPDEEYDRDPDGHPRLGVACCPFCGTVLGKGAVVCRMCGKMPKPPEDFDATATQGDDDCLQSTVK